MPNNELQELLGARFERYEHSTDDSVWTAIESKLDEEQSNKAGIWFWFLNGTAIALFATFLIQPSLFTSKTSEVQLASTITPSKKNDSSVASTIDSEEVKQSISSLEKSNNDLRLNEQQGNVASNQSTTFLPTKPINGSNSSVRFTAGGENPMIPDPSAASRLENDISPGPSSATRLPGTISHLPLHSVTAVGTLNQPKLSSSDFQMTPRTFLKPIPIFLNVQTSYLHRMSPTVGTSSMSSDPSVILNHLANNRHFNINALMQFQLTPRFNAGIGIGYSRSSYSNDYQSASNQGVATVHVRANQSIYLLPVQAKYTLIQRGKFQFNLGLTWSNEFGKTESSTKTFQQDSWLTTSSPNELIESNAKGNNSFHQMAFEPFTQVTYQFLPRFSAHVDAGYRRYIGRTQLGDNSTDPLHFWQTTFGLSYQLR